MDRGVHAGLTEKAPRRIDDTLITLREWLSNASAALVDPNLLALQIATYPRLPERDAARMIGYSVKTLQKWRLEGGGPAYLKSSMDGGVRYRLKDLLAWEDERVHSSTSNNQMKDDAGARTAARHSYSAAPDTRPLADPNKLSEQE